MMTFEVQVKIVFPGFLSGGSGLNLGQVDIVGGQIGQKLMECPRSVLDREDDGCFIVS